MPQKGKKKYPDWMASKTGEYVEKLNKYKGEVQPESGTHIRVVVSKNPETGKQRLWGAIFKGTKRDTDWMWLKTGKLRKSFERRMQAQRRMSKADEAALRTEIIAAVKAAPRNALATDEVIAAIAEKRGQNQLKYDESFDRTMRRVLKKMVKDKKLAMVKKKRHWKTSGLWLATVKSRVSTINVYHLPGVEPHILYGESADPEKVDALLEAVDETRGAVTLELGVLKHTVYSVVLTFEFREDALWAAKVLRAYAKDTRWLVGVEHTPRQIMVTAYVKAAGEQHALRQLRGLLKQTNIPIEEAQMVVEAAKTPMPGKFSRRLTPYELDETGIHVRSRAGTVTSKKTGAVTKTRFWAVFDGATGEQLSKTWVRGKRQDTLSKARSEANRFAKQRKRVSKDDLAKLKADVFKWITKEQTPSRYKIDYGDKVGWLVIGAIIVAFRDRVQVDDDITKVVKQLVKEGKLERTVEKMSAGTYMHPSGKSSLTTKKKVAFYRNPKGPKRKDEADSEESLDEAFGKSYPWEPKAGRMGHGYSYTGGRFRYGDKVLYRDLKFLDPKDKATPIPGRVTHVGVEKVGSKDRATYSVKLKNGKEVWAREYQLTDPKTDESADPEKVAALLEAVATVGTLDEARAPKTLKPGDTVRPGTAILARPAKTGTVVSTSRSRSHIDSKMTDYAIVKWDHGGKSQHPLTDLLVERYTIDGGGVSEHRFRLNFDSTEEARHARAMINTAIQRYKPFLSREIEYDPHHHRLTVYIEGSSQKAALRSLKRMLQQTGVDESCLDEAMFLRDWPSLTVRIFLMDPDTNRGLEGPMLKALKKLPYVSKASMGVVHGNPFFLVTIDGTKLRPGWEINPHNVLLIKLHNDLRAKGIDLTHPKDVQGRGGMGSMVRGQRRKKAVGEDTDTEEATTSGSVGGFGISILGQATPLPPVPPVPTKRKKKRGLVPASFIVGGQP